MTWKREAFLADGAARELDAREKHYPAMVERKEMTAEAAEADLAAWRAIATLFREGSVETPLTWADLEAAAAAALERRTAALNAAPNYVPALHERQTVVAGLHARIASHRRLYAMRPAATDRRSKAA